MAKKKQTLPIIRSSAAEYLTDETTLRNFRIVQTEGQREVAHEQAKLHAETEFEKYRVVQDRLYESDFDRMLKQLGPDSGSDGNG